MKHRLLIPSLLILCFACQRGIQKDNDNRVAQIEKSLYPIYNIRGSETAKTIPQMMRENNIAGLSMAFVDHGKIVWQKCYGYADLGDSLKITPATLFRAASLSKPLTAMAALHYAEQGKLALDEDINGQMKGWELPDNAFTQTQKVTARHLIGHRSGIKNEMHNDLSDAPVPALEELLEGKTQYPGAQVISVPGEKYKYSNMGYMVLSKLLTDVAGKDFPALMEDAVLCPCGMKNSTFEQEPAPGFRQRIATGHDENGQVVPFYQHASSGAGALWTTPTDLALFLGEILNTCHGKGGRVISTEMAREVFAENEQKLGFNKNFGNGNFVIRNDGSIPGYNCILMGSVTKNQGVVLMLNTGSDKAYDFLNFLWRAVSMEYDWGYFEPDFYDSAELPIDSLSKYPGLYSNGNDSLRITLNNGQLQVSSAETGTKTLTPVSHRAFLIVDIPMKFAFELDSARGIVSLWVRDSGGNGRAPYKRIV